MRSKIHFKGRSQISEHKSIARYTKNRKEFFVVSDENCNWIEAGLTPDCKELKLDPYGDSPITGIETIAIMLGL